MGKPILVSYSMIDLILHHNSNLEKIIDFRIKKGIHYEDLKKILDRNNEKLAELFIEVGYV